MARYLFFFFTVICFSAIAQENCRTFSSFIPAGYTILDSAAGDLNKDGFKDYILILQLTDEQEHADTTRPLLLLKGTGKDRFDLFAANDSVVLCRGCGGVFGDPYAGITVKSNFFSIEHYGGSNWRWTRIITFRYDVKTKQFILHRDAGESYHTSDQGKTKLSLHSKEDFGKLPFAKYSYDKVWLNSLK